MSSIGLQKAARIRAIHAACRAKGIDDDARRDLQQSLTGKASLSEMSFAEVSRVLDHLNKGDSDKAGNEWAFVFQLASERRAYGKKIYRLAERIGALQSPPVPVMTKAYIEGISSRMTGTDHPLQFCDCEQLHKIVQALEVYVKRHGG